MRIRKDKTSWHASGVIKRDTKQDKSTPEEAKHSSKKNTRKWCLGKIGRPHKLVWQQDNSYWSFWWKLICVNCYKVLENCWGECRNPDEHTHGPQP